MRSISIILCGILICGCTKNISETFHCGDKLITKSDDDEYLDEIYNATEQQTIVDDDEQILFPLRIVSVVNPTVPIHIYRPDVDEAVEELNKAFAKSKIQFEIKEVDQISLVVNIEDVARHGFRQYYDFSLEHDRSDRITIYLFDDNADYCRKDGETISCRRTHGFSFIMNETYLNIVLTKQDLINKKVMAHEMGHFLGLHHTFRKDEGSELVTQSDCRNTGDHLCSTPADPGDAYQVYVDYTNCEMFGLKDRNGNEYKPMINNYMSYYSPCYLKPFAFTQEQLAVMRQGALSSRRSFLIASKI